MLEFLAELIIPIVLIVMSGVGAYIVAYIRARRKEVIDNVLSMDDIRDQIKMLKRTLVMVGKKLDKGSKKYHQDLDSAYEELVKDLLRDEPLGNGKTPV